MELLDFLGQQAVLEIRAVQEVLVSREYPDSKVQLETREPLVSLELLAQLAQME
jgi:hypothetical protein